MQGQSRFSGSGGAAAGAAGNTVWVPRIKPGVYNAPNRPIVKLVDLSANPAEVAQGRAPPGSQALPLAEGGGFMAVQRRVMVSGDQLTDARQGYDPDGRATVDLVFNSAGARRF